jgi:predicted histidine transporter YuiF (NhaC family)
MTQSDTPDTTLRFLVKFHLIAGLLLIAFGYGQFFLFMGLDSLGVIEIGNALGNGLLLWFIVPGGILSLLLGLLLALISAFRQARRRRSAQQ